MTNLDLVKHLTESMTLADKKELATFLFGDELLTSPQVCRQLKITPNTLCNWVRKGKLHPVIKEGQTRRYRNTEIIKMWRS